jgi:hypothetical protein
MRVPSICAVGLFLCPTLATAQPAAQPSGPEVMGVIAVSNLWDDESRLGFGVAGGAGVGYRWRGRLGIEARVEGFAHERTFTSGVRFRATGTRYLGQVVYYWSDGNVQPFAAGTLGVIKVKRRSEFPVEQPGPTGAPLVIDTDVFERDLTDTVWGGSGGVRIQLNDRFALRPDAGILLSTPSNYLDLRFGVTAIVSW